MVGNAGVSRSSTWATEIYGQKNKEREKGEEEGHAGGPLFWGSGKLLGGNHKKASETSPTMEENA